MYGRIYLSKLPLESFTQMTIGTDTACDNQSAHIHLLKRFDAFFHQGINDGMLKTGGNIGANFRVAIRAIS